MADRKCTGAQEAPLCCEVAWLRRRQALEDMPMNRVSARDEDDCPGCECCCGCGCGCGCPEVAAALEEQNKLLYDILASINALTVAHLAIGQQ